MDEINSHIDIRLIGADADPEVDATVLAAALSGLQRAVYYLAMDSTNQSETTEGYVPRDIERRFPVRCQIPKQGSYQFAAVVGAKNDLLISQEASAIVDQFMECLAALQSECLDPFRNMNRTGNAAKILNALRTMIPKAGTPWKIEFTSKSRTAMFTGKESAMISSLRESLVHRNKVRQTITGHLQAMDFDHQLAMIQYPVTRKEIQCSYDSDWEPEVIEYRRELVHVTGDVTLDTDGYPSRITDVTNICPVDLAPFELKDITWHDTVLEFRNPMVLTPELTETKQFMVLKNDDLQIDVIARTREELLDELSEQIYMLWHEYAEEPDDRLTPAAQALASRLRDNIAPAVLP